MRGYVAQRRNRFYAVIYEGIDPITGRERRRWHPAGTDKEQAEKLATASCNKLATDPLVRVLQPPLQGRSLSGLRTAHICRIRSPARSNANTVTVTPSC